MPEPGEGVAGGRVATGSNIQTRSPTYPLVAAGTDKPYSSVSLDLFVSLTLPLLSTNHSRRLYYSNGYIHQDSRRRPCCPAPEYITDPRGIDNQRSPPISTSRISTSRGLVSFLRSCAVVAYHARQANLSHRPYPSHYNTSSLPSCRPRTLVPPEMMGVQLRPLTMSPVSTFLRQYS